jgi:hypothetical protein
MTSIVAHITKPQSRSWWRRILMFYSPSCVEEEFSEVCSLLVILSSAEAAFPRSRKAMPGYTSHGIAE